MESKPNNHHKVKTNRDGFAQNRFAVVLATHKECPSMYKALKTFRNIIADGEDLIFIDNGSEKGLNERVQNEFPDITVLRLADNRMFCGGYNAGIRLAMDRNYDFVLISNADTEVINPDFIGKLMETAHRWPKASFLGPLVYRRTPGRIQKTCLNFPHVFRNIWLWIPWHYGLRRFDKQTGTEGEVEFLNGVCVLCRIKALREIGLMDENMGGYMEDGDWAWRAKKKGWSSVFIPVPSIVHHEDQNGYEPYSLKTFLLKRNTVYWYLKNGMRFSAISYAKASIILEKVRLLSTRRIAERKRYEYFFGKLVRSYKGVLRNEPLGEWFGPPLGPWEMSAES
jgi:GT2 family glycosyltransferase